MSESRADRARWIRQLLATEGDAVHENTTLFNPGQYEATAELAECQALKDRAGGSRSTPSTACPN